MQRSHNRPLYTSTSCFITPYTCRSAETMIYSNGFGHGPAESCQPFRRKHVRFRALFSTLLTLPALAGAGTLSCSPATLQDYLNASSVDCGRLQTSGFVYSDGGSGIPATDIYTASGLQFAIGTIGVGGLNLIPISVAAGQTLTITISFQTRLLNPIVPPEGIFQSDLEMFVFDASGPGSLTIRSRECLGGLWSGSICPGTSLRSEERRVGK